MDKLSFDDKMRSRRANAMCATSWTEDYYEDQPGTSRSTRQIARELGISERRIAKVELNLVALVVHTGSSFVCVTKTKTTGSSQKHWSDDPLLTRSKLSFYR